MKRTIITISIVLLFVLCYHSNSISSNFLVNAYNSNSKNSELWAVIVTVGEPARDDKNAKDLYKILTNHGWNKSNIYYIKEEQATKDAIVSIPDWLDVHGADEDDLILFYFSMHGGRTQDVPPLDEPDGLDEYVVAYDNEILDDELGLIFDKIKSENLVLIFETCYSGGMIDGANDLKKSGRIVITSSKEDETSYGIFLIKSWLFPYYLIRGLEGKADKNHDGIITAEEVYEFAKIRTIIRSTFYGFLLLIFHKDLFIQHPQIYDGWPSEENNKEELKLIYIN